jgi:hypothetical protein
VPAWAEKLSTKSTGCLLGLRYNKTKIFVWTYTCTVYCTVDIKNYFKYCKLYITVTCTRYTIAHNYAESVFVHGGDAVTFKYHMCLGVE